MKKLFLIGLTAIASCILLSSCASTSTAPKAPLDLTIIHMNDHHSSLDQRPLNIEWGGQTWVAEAGGVGRAVAMIKKLRKENSPELTLHAGDAVTGSLYYTRFGSKPDATWMTQVCFDAFTIGNHEFDHSDAGLKTFLDQLQTPSCKIPVLSANTQPKVGQSALTPKGPWDSFKPYTIVERQGEKIAIIGLTIANKTKNSSQPDPETQFLDETATAKRYVAELQQQGIEKIILLTHWGYQNDLALAKAVPAIDVIIGGDSHTLLGNFAEFGLDSKGPYPTIETNASGQPVCIAHAYQYALAVGELHVQFDGKGNVASCNGQPHMLLGDIKPEQGMVTTLEPVKNALEASGAFTFIAPDPATQTMIDGYAEKLSAFANEVVADVPQTICKQSVGEPRKPGCAAGISSGAHRVVAEAFLHAVPDADFAIQNGGGVRADIPAGPLSVKQIFEVLPFANTLVKLEITGAEFKQAMEQALTYAITPDGSFGAYPYGAGIQYSVNMQAPEGDRVSNLKVWDKATQSWQGIRPRQTYTMVTNSFIAGGQDGWRTLRTIALMGRATNTQIDYAQSLVDYARDIKVLKRPTEFATQAYQAAK